MKKQRFLAVLLSVALAFTPAIDVMAEENATQTEEGSSTGKTEESGEVDQTEAKNQYSGTNEGSAVEEGGIGMDGQDDAQEQQGMGTVGGYISSELDYNTPVYYGESNRGKRARSTKDVIPAKYPSDGIQGITDKYPANRNQGIYGTCWAFSALGLAEFDLINDNSSVVSNSFTKDSIDFSELQLVYFTYNFVTDPLGGTIGDSATYYKENSSEKYGYLSRGGNYDIASRRLSQWIGVVDEKDVPYENAYNVLQNGLESSLAYGNNAAHLENTYLINIKENPSEVKKQIMEHGAAGIMYNHSKSGANYAINTYYDTDRTGGGHAVMVVGWDDDYSKNNFEGNVKPSNDGAWLVRNSWGPNYFSYFWMSYETVSLSDTAWIFDFEEKDGYDNNYQVDSAVAASKLISQENTDPFKGAAGSTDVTDNTHVCNIFNVTAKDGVRTETLKAVSLSMRETSNVSYKIEIYTDVPYDDYQKIYRPEQGNLQTKATTTGKTTYCGYYTIPLANEVELKPGTNYAVAVTVDKTALDYEVAVGECSAEDTNKIIWDCRASQADGKSMWYANYMGKPWATWARGNFCIKAFTSNNYEVIKDISQATITRNEDFTEDNASITVNYSGVGTLTKDKDYTVSVSTDSKGTTVTVTGQGDYTGTLAKTFVPVNNLSLKCKDIAYTGTAVMPEVIVKNGDTVLSLDSDFSVTYSNNVEVSEKAVATITGKGDYYGSVDLLFQIYKDVGGTLKNYSLTLDGMIGFNFYFDLTDEVCADQSAYVLFTLPDGRQQKQYVKDAIFKDGMYRFTCGVYASEMTQDVKFYMVRGDGSVGKKYSYSVEDYCKNPLNATDAVSEKLKPLIKAMLNYGGYAQDEFDKYLDNKAYKNVKEEFTDEMNALTVDQFEKYKFKIESKDENYAAKEVSLLLKEETTLRIYIDVKDSAKIVTTAVTVDGEAASLQKNSKGYYVDIPAIQSNKLDKEHTVQVGELIMKGSALSYVYTCLKHSTAEKDINVAKAVYIYCLRSKEYFG